MTLHLGDDHGNTRPDRAARRHPLVLVLALAALGVASLGACSSDTTPSATPSGSSVGALTGTGTPGTSTAAPASGPGDTAATGSIPDAGSGAAGSGAAGSGAGGGSTTTRPGDAGSSNDPNGPRDPNTPTGPGAGPTTVPGGSGSPTPSGPGPSASVPIDPAHAAFCQRVDRARTELASLDIANNPAGLTGYQKIIGELTALAPPAISTELTAVNNAVQSAKDYSQLQSLGSPELVAATDRIDKWTTDNCGISLSDG